MNGWLLLAMGAGAACAALGFLWLSAVLSARGGEDRRYLDRPPAFWRLAWPLTQPLAVHLGSLLSVRSRFDQLERLRRGGLDRALSPEQYVAGRAVAALAAAMLAAAAWSPRGTPPAALLVFAAALGWALPASWLRDRIEARRRAVLRELPFYLDVITLAVEAGLNLPVALAQAVDKGPRGPLRVELGRVLRDLRAGRPRAEALRALSERLATPAVASLVAALLVAEKQGSALGPVLRAQAEQRRNERFLRAEKLAMEAPVKMLPPLLVFVFPCTFLVLLFPVASRFLEEGWLR
jgi:tight adherence protein C